jgi:hypothetical protein
MAAIPPLPKQSQFPGAPPPVSDPSEINVTANVAVTFEIGRDELD